MNKPVVLKNIARLYIIIWLLYAFHWNSVSIPFVDSISNLLLGANLAISVFFVVKLFSSCGITEYCRTVLFLVFIFAFYGLLSILGGEQHVVAFSGTPIKTATYIVSVLRSFLPLLVFIYFSQQRCFSIREIRFWSIILIVIYFFIFFRSSFLHYLATNSNEYTNNAGYVVLALFPLVFFFDKHIILQFALVSFISILVLTSMKRGAIIIDIILVLYFFRMRLFEASKRERLIVLLSLVLLIIIIVKYYIFFSNNNALFQYRLIATLEGNLSGRDTIVSELKYYYFNEANIFQMIFGSGADSTLDIASNYAHNDWWEILINQGLFGLLVYLFYWFHFYKEQKTSISVLRHEVLGSNFIIYFMSSFFSMSYAALPLAFAFSMGYVIAHDNNYSNDLYQ